MAPVRVLSRAELCDESRSWPIQQRETLGRGRVSAFVNDTIATPGDQTIQRQFTTHPGAVGVIAWNQQDQIAVVKQYRHPVGYELIEPPAGLLDHDNEEFLLAAQRELAEEVGLAAEHWKVLVDLFTSPGASEESLRIYLATDLTPTDAPVGFEAEGEEIEMEVCWAARADLLEAIFAGQLQNPTMVTGLLALETARLSGRLDQLRVADACWGARTVWSGRVTPNP